MARVTDHCLQKTLELADRMLRLADEGDAVREDPACGVLYGVLRDSAYKLKRLAEAERQAHRRKKSLAQMGRRLRRDGKPPMMR